MWLKWALVFSVIGIIFASYSLTNMQILRLHLFGIDNESGFFFILATQLFVLFFVHLLYLDNQIIYNFIAVLFSAVLWFIEGSLAGIIYQKFISKLNSTVKRIIYILIPVMLLIFLASVYLTAEPLYNHWSMPDCTNKLYQLKFNFNIDQCYMETYFGANNLSDCDFLPIPPGDGMPIEVKVGEEVWSYEGSGRYDCYGVIASRKNDFTICGKIPQATFPKTVSECNLNVACLNHNCQALSDPWRSRCESSGSCKAK